MRMCPEGTWNSLKVMSLNLLGASRYLRCHSHN